jgi:hypothetical protein
VQGDLHYATRAGEPGCRSKERAPRLTSDCRIVACSACRDSTAFNSALRWWLLKRLRADREVAHAA